jgi:Tfp pilus assembly protein PilX
MRISNPQNQLNHINHQKKQYESLYNPALSAWLNLNKINKKSTTQGKGFALAAVMFILLITAIISTTAIKTGLLNENLAQSQNQIDDARQNAELTLRDAVDNVLCRFQNNAQASSTTQITNRQNFTGFDDFAVQPGICQAGLCGANVAGKPLWQTLHQANSTLGFARYGQFTRSALINQNLGRYLIEAVQTNFAHGNGQNAGDPTAQEYQYRITAVGFSAQNARVYKKVQVLLRPMSQKCSYHPIANDFKP